MLSSSPLTFEDALFGGIDTILHYYDNWIKIMARKHEDRSRATLNADDLAQRCRLVIDRCWRQQSDRLDIKNFDMLVRMAVRNILISLKGQEYCVSRGRFTLMMTSELARPGYSDEEQDFESVAYQQDAAPLFQQDSHYDDLVAALHTHIEVPHLQEVFKRVVLDHSPKYLDPTTLNPYIVQKLTETLRVTEDMLRHNLCELSFILQGFAYHTR